MKNLNKVIFLSLGFLSTNISFGSSFSTIEIPGTNLELSTSNSSTYVTLGYKNSTTEIGHFERSNEIDFYSLNENKDVNTHMVNLGASKEFLKGKSFTISLISDLGFGLGQNETDLKVKTNISKDNAKEYYYGAGVSVNLNFIKSDLRIQPFFATQYKRSHLSYQSFYRQDSDSSQFVIENDYLSQGLQHTLGLRFFNQDKSLLSFFNIDYFDSDDSIERSSSKREGTSIQLINNSSIKKNPVQFTVGFGFML